MAKEVLDSKKIKYTIIDAEDNAEMSKKLGIKQAPTLLEIKKDEVTKYNNVSNIKKFIGNKK